MKIGNPAEKPPVVPVANNRAPAGEAAAKPQAAAATVPTEASAHVDISSTAATLMSGVGGSSPEFDAQKVARMSQAIADGSFKVDHAAIADKLLANAQELLTNVSK